MEMLGGGNEKQKYCKNYIFFGWPHKFEDPIQKNIFY